MTNKVIEIFQWVWILLIGFITSVNFNYSDILSKVVVTTLSMGVGTIVSFYIKKYLNKKK